MYYIKHNLFKLTVILSLVLISFSGTSLLAKEGGKGGGGKHHGGGGKHHGGGGKHHHGGGGKHHHGGGGKHHHGKHHHHHHGGGGNYYGGNYGSGWGLGLYGLGGGLYNYDSYYYPTYDQYYYPYYYYPAGTSESIYYYSY